MIILKKKEQLLTAPLLIRVTHLGLLYYPINNRAIVLGFFGLNIPTFAPKIIDPGPKVFRSELVKRLLSCNFAVLPKITPQPLLLAFCFCHKLLV
jgi:hypothetical protein